LPSSTYLPHSGSICRLGVTNKARAWDTNYWQECLANLVAHAREGKLSFRQTECLTYLEAYLP